MKSILIIQGHPDSAEPHFCHALASAYGEGAVSAGHTVHTIDLARHDIPLLRSKREWETETPPEFVKDGQEKILAADHIVFLYPLWLGTMPALMKAWLEHVLRPNFAFDIDSGPGWTANLKGRSARVVVTMGMPAAAYRWFFLAHSLKSFERNILKFSGIRPVRWSLIGMVDAKNSAGREAWLKQMKADGAAAR